MNSTSKRIASLQDGDCRVIAFPSAEKRAMLAAMADEPADLVMVREQHSMRVRGVDALMNELKSRPAAVKHFPAGKPHLQIVR